MDEIKTRKTASISKAVWNYMSKNHECIVQTDRLRLTFRIAIKKYKISIKVKNIIDNSFPLNDF